MNKFPTQEKESIQELLADLVEQIQSYQTCGCGHPACNDCRRDEGATRLIQRAKKVTGMSNVDQLIAELKSICGCGNRGCIIYQPEQHTNGPCRCHEDSKRMRRMGLAVRRFLQDAKKEAVG